MSKRGWVLFVHDMLESVQKVEEYVRGLTYEGFLQDTKTIDAVVRNLEIIGEAARRVPDEIHARYPDIPWSQIVGLRNRLAHGYFAVDEEIVWDIVANELPPLKRKLERILREVPK